MMQILGSELGALAQAYAKRRFVHRFTKEHKPQWAYCNYGTKPHFASDADWLAHTFFWVTKAGKISERHKYCESSPTWPDGK
jgi:hypothetical protein